MHIAIFVVACDFKDKTHLGPTPMSTSSWLFCPGCDYDKTSKDKSKPFSFLSNPSCPCSQNATRWKLRTTESMTSALKIAFKIKKKSRRQKFMRLAGLRTSLESVM